jgi:Glycosyltransferase like family 2
MNYAPIAIFVYKRPDHTRRTIEALLQCPEFAESLLYVFCDGAKKPEDQAAIDETRAVVRSIVGEKAKMIEAAQNQGLANSIIAGVSKLLDEFDRVIVLEDDLIVSPHFLSYMNVALETYQNESLVMQVSGYMFPIKEMASQTEAMFLPFTASWGWGTWRRAWDYFDPNATGWEVLKTDAAMKSRFNLNEAYNYFDMLASQMSGEIDSWAIRWYWSVFQNNGCVLYPSISHVDNIGIDGSGTHGSFTGKEFKITKDISLSSSLEKFPSLIQTIPSNYQLVTNWIRNNSSIWRTVLKKIILSLFPRISR